jgi:hypothetical protein
VAELLASLGLAVIRNVKEELGGVLEAGAHYRLCLLWLEAAGLARLPVPGAGPPSVKLTVKHLKILMLLHCYLDVF